MTRGRESFPSQVLGGACHPPSGPSQSLPGDLMLKCGRSGGREGPLGSRQAPSHCLSLEQVKKGRFVRGRT